MPARKSPEGGRFPANPPDPAAARAQLAAEAAAVRRTWQAFIRDEVLPRVNGALYSRGGASYKAGALRITGNRTRVRVICNMYETITWVKYLLTALEQLPAYREYAVSFGGIRSTNPHHRSGDLGFEDVPLDKTNLQASADTFRSQNTKGYFCVTIEL